MRAFIVCVCICTDNLVVFGCQRLIFMIEPNNCEINQIHVNVI